jgi:hypothetical protein
MSFLRQGLGSEGRQPGWPREKAIAELKRMGLRQRQIRLVTSAATSFGRVHAAEFSTKPLQAAAKVRKRAGDVKRE